MPRSRTNTTKTCDIPNAPGYRVHYLGWVESNVPRGRGAHPGPYRKLKASPAKGRPSVNIKENGTRRQYMVHTLVARMFIGPRPRGMEIRHLDGDCLNNRADNLAYGTPSRNQRDRHWHGTATGWKGGACRLTPPQVVEIRAALKNRTRKTRQLLASKYGVTYQAIRAIEVGKLWAEAPALFAAHLSDQ